MISEVPTMAPSDDEYRIKEDARTLIEAEMIRKTPARKKSAIAYIQKENAARASAVKK